MIGIEVSRHRDHVFGVVAPAAGEHALAAAKVDFGARAALESGVSVSIGEKEKQAFDLQVVAVDEQLLETGRA